MNESEKIMCRDDKLGWPWRQIEHEKGVKVRPSSWGAATTMRGPGPASRIPDMSEALFGFAKSADSERKSLRLPVACHRIADGFFSIVTLCLLPRAHSPLHLPVVISGTAHLSQAHWHPSNDAEVTFTANIATDTIRDRLDIDAFGVYQLKNL